MGAREGLSDNCYFVLLCKAVRCKAKCVHKVIVYSGLKHMLLNPIFSTTEKGLISAYEFRYSCSDLFDPTGIGHILLPQGCGEKFFPWSQCVHSIVLLFRSSIMANFKGVGCARHWQRL